MAGWGDPHLKHAWSNRHPLHTLPAWKRQQVPFGKDGERVRNFPLSEGNWGFGRKFVTALTQSSQWIASHGY